MMLNLAEFKKVLGEHVITKKGTVGTDRFYFLKNLIERFDGNTIYFR